MITLREHTIIRASMARCSDLARNVEVHLAGNTHRGETAVAIGGVTEGLIGMGDSVTWQARHFGVRQRLTSKITALERPAYFQDIMLRGQVGHILTRHFCARGQSAIVLSHSSSTEVGNCASWQLLPWDGDTQGNWTTFLEGADVCINLVASVDCRYNRKNRKAIYDSRVRTTVLLNEFLATLKAPRLWINASTQGACYRRATNSNFRVGHSRS